jgi:hypothetical protein
MKVELHGLPVVGERLFVALRGSDWTDKYSLNYTWSEVRLGQGGTFSTRNIDNSGMQLTIEPQHLGAMIKVQVSGGHVRSSAEAISWPVMTIDTPKRMSSNDVNFISVAMLDDQKLLSEWEQIGAARAELEKDAGYLAGKLEAAKQLDEAQRIKALADKRTAEANSAIERSAVELETARIKTIEAEKLMLKARKLVALPEDEARLQSSLLALNQKVTEVRREIDLLMAQRAEIVRTAEQVRSHSVTQAEQIIEEARERALAINGAIDAKKASFERSIDLRFHINEAIQAEKGFQQRRQQLEDEIQLWLTARNLRVPITSQFLRGLMDALPDLIEEAKSLARDAERIRKASEWKAPLCPSGTCAVAHCNC